MRKLMLVGSAMAMFAVGGCSHYVANKGAEYHQAKADQAARHGDYGKAADQERKADRDADRAAAAPLP
jgi:outer membrane lipoprotein SlyB